MSTERLLAAIRVCNYIRVWAFYAMVVLVVAVLVSHLMRQ